MKNTNILYRVLWVGVLALAACGAFDGSITSSSAPPANESEAKPVLMNPRAEVWRAGYWAPGENGGFTWVSGKIIPRPSPSAVWANAYWTHHAFGWTFVPGHWE